MPTYEYRCDRDGRFEVRRPPGQADPTAPCPTCDGHGMRVFSRPMLSRVHPQLGRAIDRADRTRETPEVVTSPPPRRGTARQPVARDPVLRTLPRP